MTKMAVARAKMAMAAHLPPQRGEAAAEAAGAMEVEGVLAMVVAGVAGAMEAEEMAKVLAEVADTMEVDGALAEVADTMEVGGALAEVVV